MEKRLPFRTACMTGRARTRSVKKPRGPTRQFSENTRCRECVKYNFRVPKPKSQNIIRNGRQVCKCWQKTSMVHIARASQPFLKNFLHRYISSYLSNLAACWRIFSSSISQLIQSKWLESDVNEGPFGEVKKSEKWLKQHFAIFRKKLLRWRAL